MVGIEEMCRTHAPRPHDECICHAVGEERQNIINELKILLDKADDRPCLIPDTRTKDQSNRPLMKYPGYVDKRHPAYSPPSPLPETSKWARPIVTNVCVTEVRPTSEPKRVADDPPNCCFKAMQYQNLRPSNQSGTSVELRGGVVYNQCLCVKRNGLQDQCPRRECGGKPECIAMNPGPCCPPALAYQAAMLPPEKSPQELTPSKEMCHINRPVALCCCCHEY
ncbi:uncharacterized protein LOC142321167 [Lycorma delicatula]|uniref:uncharacterized protein LOC142321167 n=1 Tax=Lycorma delicatula TaxID=130591 RepID=UPI003F51A49C